MYVYGHKLYSGISQYIIVGRFVNCSPRRAGGFRPSSGRRTRCGRTLRTGRVRLAAALTPFRSRPSTSDLALRQFGTVHRTQLAGLEPGAPYNLAAGGARAFAGTGLGML